MTQLASAPKISSLDKNSFLLNTQEVLKNLSFRVMVLDKNACFLNTQKALVNLSCRVMVLHLSVATETDRSKQDFTQIPGQEQLQERTKLRNRTFITAQTLVWEIEIVINNILLETAFHNFKIKGGAIAVSENRQVYVLSNHP